MRPLSWFAWCTSSLLLPISLQAAEPALASARLDLVKGPGSEQCIDRPALRNAVDARLKRQAFRNDVPATLHIEIALERKPPGWSARLTLRGVSGELLGQRSLVSATRHCSALDDSLALVVALLVDSPPTPEAADVRVEAPTGKTESAQPPPQSSEQELTTLEIPRETLAPREPWQFASSIGGSATFGLLPGLATGVELGIAGKAPGAPVMRLFATAYVEREQRRVGSNSGANFDFTQLSLDVCPWDRTFGAVRWLGCLGQSIGRLKARAFGFDQNSASQRLTFALRAETELKLAFSRTLGGRVGLRAELPLQRAIFSYGARDGSDRDLFSVKPITAALDIGLIVRLSGWR